MRGDGNKVSAYIQQYGVEFVLDAIEKAVYQKEAEEMMLKKLKTDHRMSEVRIVRLAKEMGVRIG